MPKISSRFLTRLLCGASLTTMVLLGSGCASIVHGGSRTVTVNSQPSGAKTTIRKSDSGEVVSVNTTPFTVSLDPRRGFFKGQSYTLRMELPGYSATEVQLRAEVSGWYFGNIVFGGLIGLLIVDPATGAMWNLSPDKIQQPLSSNHAELIKSGRGFVVMMISDLTDAEKTSLVRIN